MNQFFFPFSFSSLLPLPQNLLIWWARMKIKPVMGLVFWKESYVCFQWFPSQFVKECVLLKRIMEIQQICLPSYRRKRLNQKLKISFLLKTDWFSGLGTFPDLMGKHFWISKLFGLNLIYLLRYLGVSMYFACIKCYFWYLFLRFQRSEMIKLYSLIYRY